MSEQPKKAADADLKDYARQRRMDLGRPQRMPEEMRARLLREAAQLTAKSAKADDSVETPAKSPEVEVPKPAREKESSGWWLAWWPRLVLATGIAAVMILVGNQFLLSSNRIRAKNIEFAKQTVATPEKEQLDRKTLNEARALAARDENRLGPAEPSLAKQEALLAQLPPADAPAPASAPQSIPAITTTVSGRPVGLLREESDQKKKAGSLAGPAANDLAELDRSAKVGDSQTLAIQPVRAPAPAIAVTASSATSLDAAKPALQSPDRGLEQQHAESKLTAGAKNDSAQLQNGTRYHQQQVYRRNFNSPPPPPVMNNFILEQNGAEVVVTDADGSVYRGRIAESPNVLAVAKDAGAAKSAASSPALGLVTQSASVANNRADFFAIQLEGTNRSLNQMVKVEANYTPETNQATSVYFQNSLANLQDKRAFQYNGLAGDQAARQFGNGLLQGRVTIGQSNQIQLNAAPETK